MTTERRARRVYPISAPIDHIRLAAVRTERARIRNEPTRARSTYQLNEERRGEDARARRCDASRGCTRLVHAGGGGVGRCYVTTRWRDTKDDLTIASSGNPMRRPRRIGKKNLRTNRMFSERRRYSGRDDIERILRSLRLVIFKSFATPRRIRTFNLKNLYNHLIIKS